MSLSILLSIAFVLWCIVGIFAFRIIATRDGLNPLHMSAGKLILILLLSGPVVFLVVLYFFAKSLIK